MFKKTKNRYPTNVNRNNYEKNRKKSTIETPKWLANFIAEKVLSLIKKSGENILLDIGCHKGNLSRPFMKDFTCIGIDNKKDVGYIGDDYSQKQFLELEKISMKPNLVVCNPPFNVADKKAMSEGKECMKHYGLSGKSPLLPEMFLRKIFELYGSDVPLVFFAPMGILKNQRLASPRWKWLRDCGAKITSEIELPIDSYGQGILVHSSVLIFNIKGIDARIFVPNKVIHRDKLVRISQKRKNNRKENKRFDNLVS